MLVLFFVFLRNKKYVESDFPVMQFYMAVMWKNGIDTDYPSYKVEILKWDYLGCSMNW